MSLEFLGIEDLFAYGIDCSFSLSLSLSLADVVFD